MKLKDDIKRWRWEFALVGCILISVIVLVVSESGHSSLQAGFGEALQANNVSSDLSSLLDAVTEAETEQRGYLLTFDERYLASYRQALPKIDVLMTKLRTDFYAMHQEEKLEQFGDVANLVGKKLAELDMTIALAKAGRYDSAHEIMRTDIGKKNMDQLRADVVALQQGERDRKAALISGWRFDLILSRASIALVTILNIVLLVMVFRWLSEDWRQEQSEQEELRRREAALDSLVQQRTAELESLASRLQQVGEIEKSKLARELHDELGAILTASRMNIAWVRQHLAPEHSALAEKLGRAMEHLDQGIHAKRRIIENLWPTTLTTLGFVAAARDLAEQTSAQANWELTLELPDVNPDVSEEMIIALFRILQEALVNAAKYAQATTIRVSLVCEDNAIMLEIEDNGVGFHPNKMRTKAHGLLGMRQRVAAFGGTLEVRSRPRNGTLVCAMMPLRDAVDAAASPAAGNEIVEERT